MKRFVLCRPQGGLNDILNQIERCYWYAATFDRLAIVDTSYVHSEHFHDRFSKYFLSRRRRLLLENPLADSELDALEAYPSAISGRVSHYRTRWSYELRNVVDAQSRELLTFDMSRQYRQPLLVHHQAGGGVESLNCLGRLVLSPAMIERLRERLSRIPRPYAALHVRNTDIKTDYRPVLAGIRQRRIPHLFVATDDARVLDECRATLPDTTIHAFSDIPDTGGQPIHVRMRVGEPEVRNSDAILDLLMLAQAKMLFLCRRLDSPDEPLSGFSKLAGLLNQNPEFIQELLGKANVPVERQGAAVT